MVRSHLLDTIIEFCEKSLILKKSPSSFLLEEDVHTYTLKYSSDRYRTIAVNNVIIDGTEIPMTETTHKEMDSEYSNWRNQESSKPTRYILEDETNKIRLWPTPNADNTKDVELICRVTFKRDQTEVDEFIHEKWEDPIQSGTISRLLVIPGASWYNPQLAGAFARAYSKGVRQARKTTLTGTGEYPGRVIPQNFVVVGSTDNRSISWE
jgi:hypothetical protein